MVEANTIRGCLQTFGMDDAITRTFVTGPMVGLSTALAFIEMSDDSLKEVMKQIAEASTWVSATMPSVRLQLPRFGWWVLPTVSSTSPTC